MRHNLTHLFYAIFIVTLHRKEKVFIIEKVLIDKALLNVEEFCAYLGIGQSKARELLRTPRNGFTVRIENRLYANKKQLDRWLDMQCSYY